MSSKYIEREELWNNIQFVPPKKNIWHRGMTDDKCYHSDILLDSGLVLSIARFTTFDIDHYLSSNCKEIKGEKEGWNASLRKNFDTIHHIGLETDDYIECVDVDAAEKEALKWARKHQLIT
tara:strand:- start:2611 stop:2973 length:363 start_codon:yes stop_codon:yes gene_type:complete